MLSKQERLRRFKALKMLIPIHIDPNNQYDSEAGQVIDWLVNNLHATRATAKVWNMSDSPRPIPEAKLKLMERFLTKDI